MRTVRKLLVTAVAVLALGAAACGSDDDEPTVDATVEEAPARAMPCAEDQVYVWVDYAADEAECVASTDHERHAGH